MAGATTIIGAVITMAGVTIDESEPAESGRADFLAEPTQARAVGLPQLELEHRNDACDGEGERKCLGKSLQRQYLQPR
jgi:hypothetical protein